MIPYIGLTGDNSRFDYYPSTDSFTRTLTNGMVYTYIPMALPSGDVSSGQPRYVLSTVVDPVGNKTTYGYNGVGQIQSITDPVGLTTTFSLYRESRHRHHRSGGPSDTSTI